MALEVVKAVFELLFLVVDIGLVVTSGAFHFKRGQTQDGVVQGAVTLALFYVAGLFTNLFHFFRHETQRLSRRSGCMKVKYVLLIFVPCYYLLRWNIKRCAQSNSLTVKCWTTSLRIFYCSTGSLVQAVFQGYVVVKLWWVKGIPDLEYFIMIVTAVFLVLHAIYGVCDYIYVHYYDETHGSLPVKDFLLIIFALFLAMCGRVVAMSVVMGTLGWVWLVVAIISPFLVNYAVYILVAAQGEPSASGLHNVCRCFFLVPLAFLAAITVSDKRALTIITTLAWLACSLPQIITYHEDTSSLLVWLVPALAQILALIVMMFKWNVFEAAFLRFTRVAQTTPWIRVPT